MGPIRITKRTIAWLASRQLTGTDYLSLAEVQVFGIFGVPPQDAIERVPRVSSSARATVARRRAPRLHRAAWSL